MTSEKVLKKVEQVGLCVPEVLLPADGLNYEKFSVIACDQFSAQPEYWDRVEEFVGDAPSSLRMILPEARLLQGGDGGDIAANMQAALDTGVFKSIGEAFVYVERGTSAGTRRGLVVAADLEKYDFKKDSKKLIRASEETVADRIPSRVEIRRSAPLEIPHAMLLIDDPDDTVMTAAQKADGAEVYSFDLMENGGHLYGKAISGDEAIGAVANALAKLKKSCDGLLYAVGDGNHSFAAAKLYWNELKKTLSPEERKTHPARFAMCEIVNVYDDALPVLPIHRLLKGVDKKAAAKELGIRGTKGVPVEKLQPALDAWLKKHPEAVLEYVHGEDECRELGKARDCLAILTAPVSKSGLFAAVREKGCLARKSFSLGEARDKRYYLEARRIK